MIKKLLKLLQGETKEAERKPEPTPTRSFRHPKVPDWKTEIVETPHYWVETNYDRIDKLPPFAVKMASKAVDEGLIVNVTSDAANSAAQLIRDTIVDQMDKHFTVDEGLWSVNFDQETTILRVRVMPTGRQHWELGKRAWKRAAEVIVDHGITIPNVEEKWDEETLRADLRISLKQIKFSVDSPVFWMVLHKNKDKIILWNNKVWVPK